MRDLGNGRVERLFGKPSLRKNDVDNDDVNNDNSSYDENDNDDVDNDDETLSLNRPPRGTQAVFTWNGKSLFLRFGAGTPLTDKLAITVVMWLLLFLMVTQSFCISLYSHSALQYPLCQEAIVTTPFSSFFSF